jgi:hypothetical protein
MKSHNKNGPNCYQCKFDTAPHTKYFVQVAVEKTKQKQKIAVMNAPPVFVFFFLYLKK